MAMMWGALISVQIVIGGLVAFVYNKIADGSFSPFYGAINAHGFAQGPVQAIAMAKTWMASPGGDTLPDLVQVGLFFAVVGYLAASLVGVPMCNRFFKKGLTTLPRADVDAELATGIYDRQTEKILGNQSMHRSNVDTLTVQIAIMVATYFVTFLITSIIDPNHETIVYSMMFIWAIIMTNIVKIVLQKLKKDHLIDPGVQTSITNFCTDCALVAVMLSLTIGVIVKYIVPLAIISILCVLVSWAMTYKFAKGTGQYVAERTATVFGIATGTAITGMLLLRVLDPEYETDVANEIVWWNIFQMIAGGVAVGVAPFAMYMGFWPWMGFNVLWGLIMLFAVYRIGKSLKKLSA